MQFRNGIGLRRHQTYNKIKDFFDLKRMDQDRAVPANQLPQ